MDNIIVQSLAVLGFITIIAGFALWKRRNRKGGTGGVFSKDGGDIKRER